MNTDLWPPLGVIRHALEAGAVVPDDTGSEPGTATMTVPGATRHVAPGAAAAAPAAVLDLLLPLTDRKSVV